MTFTREGYKTYHYDYRGSTTAITNENGNLTDRIYYDPYGTVISRMGSTETPFLCVGKYGVETDADGLYYMRARYYNPKIQRFINVDPIRDGVNWYVYTYNSPSNYIDFFGKEIENPLKYFVEKFLSSEPDWDSLRNYTDNLMLKTGFAGYITNQYGGNIPNYRFGAYELSYNGCEIIAVYNCLKRIGHSKNLADIIYYFENNALGIPSVNASLGILPQYNHIEQYLTTLGCTVQTVEHLNAADSFMLVYDAIIISYWNNKEDKSQGIHTVAALKINSGWNVYNYTNIPYHITSISDFINMINFDGTHKDFINAKGVKYA